VSSGGGEGTPGRAGGLLRREVLPDPGGLLGFTILLLVLVAYVSIRPDRDGRLFSHLTGLLPALLRSPLLEAALEALAQSFLLVGPLIACYSSLRHLRRSPPRLLPFITAAGGGFLSLLLAGGLIAQYL
jgi:hypothetical protein